MALREALGPGGECNWLVSREASFLETRLGQAGNFDAAILQSVSAGGYDFRALVESGGGICSCYHHLLCQAQITSSGSTLIGGCMFGYLPSDLAFEFQLFQFPHILG